MNSKGSLVIGLTFLIPMFLVICSVTAWLLFMVKTKEQIQHSCRKQVLKSQQTLIRYGERIRKLNSYARYLRGQRKLAQTLMKNPISFVAGKALYKLTITLQKALKTKQQFLFKLGEARASLQLMALKKTLHKIAKSPTEAVFLKVHSYRSKVSKVKIRLTKKNREIAPVYDWPVDLPRKQSLSTNWVLTYEKSGFFKKWLAQKQKNTWKGQCFSRPMRRRSKWISVLGKVR